MQTIKTRKMVIHVPDKCPYCGQTKNHDKDCVLNIEIED